MNEFYQVLNQPLFYKWILSHQKMYLEHHIDFYTDDIEQTMHFNTDTYLGTLYFWQDDMIEESIVDKENQRPVFYLHFQIAHFAQAQFLFYEFINYLLLGKHQVKSILLCCSSGLSTSLFATKLQEIADHYHLPYYFEATSIHRLQDETIHHDLIVLAPQVSYLEPYVEKHVSKHVPITSFNSLIFATNDYLEAFNHISSILTERAS